MRNVQSQTYLVEIKLPFGKVFRNCKKEASNAKEAAERCKHVHPFWYKLTVRKSNDASNEILYSCISFQNRFFYLDDIILK